MIATPAVVVPPEKAAQIDNIFDGLVGLGCQLAKAADGIRDGIVLRHTFKTQSLEAQEYCIADGVLVGEGWLSMVVVQGRLKGLIRTHPKAPAVPLPVNLLLFPKRRCEKSL